MDSMLVSPSCSRYSVGRYRRRGLAEDKFDKDAASLLPSVLQNFKTKHEREISKAITVIVDGIPTLLDLLDHVVTVFPVIKRPWFFVFSGMSLH